MKCSVTVTQTRHEIISLHIPPISRSFNQPDRLHLYQDVSTPNGEVFPDETIRKASQLTAASGNLPYSAEASTPHLHSLRTSRDFDRPKFGSWQPSSGAVLSRIDPLSSQTTIVGNERPLTGQSLSNKKSEHEDEKVNILIIALMAVVVYLSIVCRIGFSMKKRDIDLHMYMFAYFTLPSPFLPIRVQVTTMYP
jgi:hypothetical protein